MCVRFARGRERKKSYEPGRGLANDIHCDADDVDFMVRCEEVMWHECNKVGSSFDGGINS